MDFSSFSNSKEIVRAACKKCGYSGHLTYQCRNFLKVIKYFFVINKSINIGFILKVDPNKEILLDVDSTSSDSDTTYLTPLTELRKTELLDKEKSKIAASKAERKKNSSASRKKTKKTKSRKRKV